MTNQNVRTNATKKCGVDFQGTKCNHLLTNGNEMYQAEADNVRANITTCHEERHRND